MNEKVEQSLIEEVIQPAVVEEVVQYAIKYLRLAVKNINTEKAFKVTLPVQLAHYTSLETLYSILDSARKHREARTPGSADGLRLYETKTLNDPAEGKHLKDFLAKSYSWIDRASDDAASAFICSFVSDSEASNTNMEIGDDLMHWNAYGEDGLGCSICYEPNQSDLLHYSHVVYDEKGAGQIAEHFKDFLELGETLCNLFDKPEQKKYFATRFWNEFDKVKFLCKSIHYKHESECRVLIFPGEQGKQYYHFNPKGLNLREYTTGEILSTSRIFKSNSQVFIGPRVQNKDSLIQNFEGLARQAGIQGVEFLPSSIPYRKI